ncbi:MAG: HEPN domain-containing protein [Candidatus Omnitrophota bacterium]
MNDTLIRYRKEKARETLDDARMLLRDGTPSSALNRIYYAMFYEVLALLHTKDLSSSKHTGVRALFNEHFVKTGIVPVELGRLFSRMYDFRQKSDYGDFVKIQPEKVSEWFEQAVAFINEIDQIIEGSLD